MSSTPGSQTNLKKLVDNYIREEVGDNKLIQSLFNTYSHALETAIAKNKDYANIGDPYANFKMVELLGITDVETGILTRMSDKFIRICNLTKRENAVTNEKIEDTLLDLINYAAILKGWYEQK